MLAMDTSHNHFRAALSIMTIDEVLEFVSNLKTSFWKKSWFREACYHRLQGHDWVLHKNFSPIHLAAWVNDANAVERLLSQGVNPNLTCQFFKDMKTPLDFALENGTETATVLLMHPEIRIITENHVTFRLPQLQKIPEHLRPTIYNIMVSQFSLYYTGSYEGIIDFVGRPNDSILAYQIQFVGDYQPRALADRHTISEAFSRLKEIFDLHMSAEDRSAAELPRWYDYHASQALRADYDTLVSRHEPHLTRITPVEADLGQECPYCLEVIRDGHTAWEGNKDEWTTFACENPRCLPVCKSCFESQRQVDRAAVICQNCHKWAHPDCLPEIFKDNLDRQTKATCVVMRHIVGHYLPEKEQQDCIEASCSYINHVPNQTSDEPVICRACQSKKCRNCHLHPHPGKSCRAMAATNRSAEKQTSRYFNRNRKNIRPCPKCNFAIEKNGGCLHMACSNPTCRHEFCWQCRRPWRKKDWQEGDCSAYECRGPKRRR